MRWPACCLGAGRRGTAGPAACEAAAAALSSPTMPPQMHLPLVGGSGVGVQGEGFRHAGCGGLCAVDLPAWGRPACSACAPSLAAGSMAHATMSAHAAALVLAVVATPCSSANPHHALPRKIPGASASDNPTCEASAGLPVHAVPCAAATCKHQHSRSNWLRAGLKAALGMSGSGKAGEESTPHTPAAHKTPKSGACCTCAAFSRVSAA